MVFGNRILEQCNFKIKLLQEEKLQHTKPVIDCMADAVFWVKPDAHFLYANDAACSLLRYSRQELLSMSMHDVKPDFLPKDWSKYWRTIKQQGYLYFETIHRTNEGQSFPVEITMTYLEYNSREYGCILIRDISQRQQLSTALQKVNQELECKVQQLLAELRDANKQLCCEKVLRQRAETALEQEKLFTKHKAHFFSIISHEFRTPLNIISLSTSLLKRHLHRWNDEKKLQYLQRLQTGVEQISQLMDEIFINSRAEAEKLKFEPKPLNIIQFCREILAQMNLNESIVTCSMLGDPFGSSSSGDDCTVCVDKTLLQPILKNLLSNAVKYSPSDSTIDLVVSCQAKEVIFQIKDRGIGISVADQQRLFKPFHRGANVSNIPGNGLGLALVKKLVDLHGGQITVASEVGVGTTFTISLPLV
jgi:PAS domain S-box-containing protein